MDAWIALARGPMFRVALAACVLGLAYHLANTLWMIYQSHQRSTDKDLPLRGVLAATLNGLLPAQARAAPADRGLARLPRRHPAGAAVLRRPRHPLAAVPAPSRGRRWDRRSATRCPSPPWRASPPSSSAGCWSGRAASSPPARTSRVLFLLLVVTVSGYWAAHPTSSPLAPRTMLLVHLLAANLALFLTPLTKIVHCVLAPLNQLVSEVAWHFPAESGTHVALALGKENDPV